MMDDGGGVGELDDDDDDDDGGMAVAPAETAPARPALPAAAPAARPAAARRPLAIHGLNAEAAALPKPEAPAAAAEPPPDPVTSEHTENGIHDMDRRRDIGQR